jgi:outer membrane beta-barrel protein
METWIQRLFLMLALVGASFALTAQAQDESAEDDDELGQIITPDIERRQIKEDDLDNENFEMGMYFGLLSIEDFGSGAVAGVTMAYHISEGFFVEGAYATSRAQETSYELLSGGVELLTDEERDFIYYNVSLGWNFFPGQVFIWDKWAFNSNFYLIAGAGNTQFAANEYFTYNFGAGLRFYGTDWLALDISTRDHVFTHEIFGESKVTNNLETRIGLSLYF